MRRQSSHGIHGEKVSEMWIAVCALWSIVAKNGLASHNGAPTIQPFSFSRNVTFGQTIKTLCTATGKEPLSFQWNKDGSPLHNSHSIKIQTHDDFSLVSLNPVDFSSPGNYTCIVKNSEGSTSYSAQLLIQAPPKWLSKPQDSSVGLEGQISLNCEVRGHPKPTIRWFRFDGEDRIAVKKSSRFEMAPNGSLIIREVKPEDAGDYECQAANDIGSAISKRMSLSVHVPARFDEKFKVESVRWGEAAILRCEAIGDNPITLTWTKSEMPVSEKESSRYEVYESSSETGATSELHLQVTDRTDNGLYVCIAKNAFGKDERTVKLVVLEVPGPPSDVRVEQTWSQSATVRWKVPYGGNTPITVFIVQFWRDAGTPHRLEEKKVSASQTFTMLKDLQPGTSYVVRVLAENEVGRGNPSESQQLLTKEAEPSSPPTDVTVEARDAGTLRVKWKAPPRDQWNGQLKGYYIGYRVSSSKDPYSFKTVEFSKQGDEEYRLTNLLRATEYQVIVQAFNSAGSGPPSQDAHAQTSSLDPPSPPFLWVDFQSRSSIGLRWKHQTSGNDTSDTLYYTLYYKDEYGPWSEVSVPKSAEMTYTLGGLREGTRYQIYLKSASEVAGESESSDMLTLKTEGGALSDMSSHPVVEKEETPVYFHLPVLIPLASSVGLIFLVLIGACIYVKRVEKRYKAAVPDGRYYYSGSSTLPRKKDPLLRIPPDGYPLPYATMPIRRPHATMERKRSAIQETAEIHHYDMAA